MCRLVVGKYEDLLFHLSGHVGRFQQSSTFSENFRCSWTRSCKDMGLTDASNKFLTLLVMNETELFLSIGHKVTFL